jgi:hypothetical protein
MEIAAWLNATKLAVVEGSQVETIQVIGICLCCLLLIMQAICRMSPLLDTLVQLIIPLLREQVFGRFLLVINV